MHLFCCFNWPAIAAIITASFPAAERGGPVSFVRAQANLGSALASAVVAGLTGVLGGWQQAFIVLGGAVVATGLAGGLVGGCPQPVSKKAAAASSASWKDVVADGRLWLCGLASMMAYLIRFGVEGWLSTFVKATVAPQSNFIASASFAWQFGGGTGALLVGPLADRHYGSQRRLPLLLCCGLTALGLFPIQNLHGNMFLVGLATASFGLYGSIVLLMLSVRQLAPSTAAGKADALASVLSEGGAVLAGWPLIALSEGLGGINNLPRILALACFVQGLCGAIALQSTGKQVKIQ